MKLTRTILVLIFCSAGFLLAQEKPQFEKKVFQRDNGQIFWQEKVPIYLQISNNPEMKDAFKMTEVATKEMEKESNPFYWDGPGVHYIRHLDYPDNPQKHQIAFVVHVDGAAPLVNSKFLDAPTFFAGGTRFYGKDLKNNMNANDERSGVENIYYSINSSEYKVYNSDLVLDKEGENTVKYFAVDSTGNDSEVKEEAFTVDLTSPNTIHAVNNDHTGNILSVRTIFKLSSDDNLSGVKSTSYTIDGENKISYIRPISFAHLPDGEHKIKYTSTDNVKNEEAEKEFTFYLDKTPPVVNTDFVGNFHENNGTVYLAGNAKVKLSATDNKAGVQDVFYSVNGKAPIKYSEPFEVKDNNLNQIIKFSGLDNVNNKGKFISDDNLNRISVDNLAPAISYMYQGTKKFTRDTMFIKTSTGVILKATDQESGVAEITYDLDGNSSQVYSNPLNIESEGLHKIKFSATDNVKNSRNDDFFFIVDNTGPEIFHHMSLENIGTQKLKDSDQEIPIYAANTQLYLAATDKLVGTNKIYYSLNSASERVYGPPIRLNKPGMYTLKIKAVDELGNTTQSDEINFVVQ